MSKKILKKGGYVYLVEGEKGFETFFNLGKDYDDPMWHENVEKEEIIFEKPKKNKKQKKSED